MKRIISDFGKLNWKRKIGVFILLYVMYFFVSEFNDVYLEQNTPCLVVNAYNTIPVSARQKTIITIKNHMKMPVFKIICEVEDNNEEYEGILYSFFKEHNYIKKEREEAYSNGEIVMYIRKVNGKIILEIVSEMKGVYK